MYIICTSVPVARLPLARCHAMLETAPMKPPTVARHVPDGRSHTRTLSSFDPENTSRRERERARDMTLRKERALMFVRGE